MVNVSLMYSCTQTKFLSDCLISVAAKLTGTNQGVLVIGMLLFIAAIVIAVILSILEAVAGK